MSPRWSVAPCGVDACAVQDVFDCAQREYMAEGVPWTMIEYHSNTAILELLEGKLGVIALLRRLAM